ncbi:hypothetical protein L1049_000464 [Liquidambar formosana]|uniref:DDE Tnp4 domain-containing protein n=1 Tax=Liquidambar formosana TaxID=63359 RepID=A0AAP0N9S2_LIQFO
MVERIFGVLKTCFPTLRMAHRYPFANQAKLVIALCVLPNHICIETRGDDWVYEQYEQENQNNDYELEVHSRGIAQKDMSTKRQLRAAKVLQDSIATDMWRDHVNQQRAM